MALTLYILCGDATYNRGDRGNLTAMIALLKETFPGVRLIVDSYRPQVDRQWYDAEVVKRGTILSRAQIEGIKRADFVVWGGGALLADNASRVKVPYWAVIMFLVRFILKKPFMTWAHGLVLNDPFQGRIARRILSWSDVVAVRDRGGYETLKRIGLARTPYYQTADPAVLVQPGPEVAGRRVLEAEGAFHPDRPLFALAVSFCPFHYNASDLIPYMIARPLGLRQDRGAERIAALKDVFARVCRSLIDRHDAHMLLLPTYPAPWEDDLDHLFGLAEQTGRADRVHVLARDAYPPEDYLAVWRHLDLMLTVPLHHSIFSVVAGAPTINLYYEPKGRDFFLALDAEDRLMDVNDLLSPDAENRLLDMVNRTLRDWPALRERTRSRLGPIQARARENAALLKQALIRRGLWPPKSPPHRT